MDLSGTNPPPVTSENKWPFSALLVTPLCRLLFLFLQCSTGADRLDVGPNLNLDSNWGQSGMLQYSLAADQWGDVASTSPSTIVHIHCCQG
jgi:hypothetical protein